MKFLTSIFLALGTVVLLGANSVEACKTDSDCTSWNAWCSKNSWTYHCDPARPFPTSASEN